MATIKTQLIKPKYDNEELQKAVDTLVDELVPAVDAPNFDLVPRPEYDALSDVNDELTTDIANLQQELDTANASIIELESTIQQREIELDQSRLAESVAQNQAESLQLQFQQLNVDFREALQKSIKEGIDKVSLQAQNDGLRAEVNALRADLSSLISTVAGLRERLEGRQAEIEQGADSLGEDLTVLSLQQSSDPTAQFDVYMNTSRNSADSRDGDFSYGKSFRLSNNGDSVIIVDVERASGVPWYNVGTSTVRLQPGEDKTVELSLNWSEIQDVKPRRWRHFRDRGYAGDLSFRVRETGQELLLRTKLQKNS